MTQETHHYPDHWRSEDSLRARTAGPAPEDGLPDQIGRALVGTAMPKQLLTKPHSSAFIAEYDYVINPYVGCTFACDYCYASNFTTPDQKDNWGLWVQMKTNAVAQLKAQPRKLLDHKNIYMSTVTDPYQPLEPKAGVTRGILEVLRDRHPKTNLVIQTRSPHVLRDKDLLLELIEGGANVQVNVSVTTDDDETRVAFEPACPSITARIRTAQTLHEAGIQTAITLTPLLPVTDPESFAERLTATGVTRFIIQALHYPGRNDRSFIAQTDPRALETAVNFFDANTPEQAVREYNARYLHDYRALRAAMDPNPDLTIGVHRHGFKPPFPPRAQMGATSQPRLV